METSNPQQDSHMGEGCKAMLRDLVTYIDCIMFSRGAPLDIQDTHPLRAVYEALGRVKTSLDATIKPAIEADTEFKLTRFCMQHAADPVLWMDHGGTIIYANQAASEMFAGSAGSVAGQPVWRIMPEMEQGSWERQRGDICARGPLKYEARCLTADSRLVSVDVTINHLSWEGRDYFFAFMHDITERKWAEDYVVQQSRHAKLRADLWRLASDESQSEETMIERMLENLGPAIGLSRASLAKPAAATGEYTVRASWSANWKPTPAGETIPAGLFDVFDRQGVFLLTPELAALMAEDSTNPEDERAAAALLVRRGLKAAAAAPYEVGGKREGWFLFEITEGLREASANRGVLQSLAQEASSIAGNYAARRRAADELYDAYTQMSELVSQKENFITRFGHDLKTPLTPLVTLTPMMDEYVSDPKGRELLNVMLQNVSTMKELVIKTLKLARVSSPAVTLKLAPISLRDAVGGYLAKRKFMLDKGMIKTENLVPKDIEVLGDTREVEELFYNLITNSIKHTPPGGAITVDAGREGGFAAVTVRDTGIGVPPEQVKHLFEEFFKADESRHDLDSSGLGLAICKKIVEKHGGAITAGSAGRGQGLTISFTLRLAGAEISGRKEAFA